MMVVQLAGAIGPGSNAVHRGGGGGGAAAAGLNADPNGPGGGGGRRKYNNLDVSPIFGSGPTGPFYQTDVPTAGPTANGTFAGGGGGGPRGPAYACRLYSTRW